MTAPTRAALSRELIAMTALNLTDEVGLPGLSMRKLGGQLGVEAMSLYHYVENKDDLLDAILERLYAEIDLPFDLPSDDWEQATRRGLVAFHQVLVQHPAALELFASRPAKSIEAFNVLGWCFGRFQAVGLNAEQSVHALHVIVSFVMGHVANELGAMAEVGNGDLPEFDDIDDPAVVEFLTHRETISPDERFTTSLDIVIAGLRATYDLP